MSDTNKEREAIKPCPFCGGKASLCHTWDEDGCYWAHIECSRCRARSGGDWTSSRMEADPIFYEEVRDKWNARAQVKEAA